MKKKDWRLYRSCCQNEDGFTLVEVLIAVSITSISVLLLSFFVDQSVRLKKEVESDRQIEWHLFLNQIEYDLKDSTLVNVGSERFVVERTNNDGIIEKVTYEKYFRIFRRRVGDEGHQPMLTKIETIQLEKKDDQLWVTVLFQNGETYTARLHISKASESKEDMI